MPLGYISGYCVENSLREQGGLSGEAGVLELPGCVMTVPRSRMVVAVETVRSGQL